MHRDGEIATNERSDEDYGVVICLILFRNPSEESEKMSQCDRRAILDR
jgi:hypothetical protein